ncbi:MAG: hypothetical protein AAF660_10340 [Pseudomonadota bacterium]
MELAFTLIKNAFLLFVGLIGILFVLALLFGKRKLTRWEFEAEFRDASGREYGEFDIEMSKIEKDESDYTFKATFNMRHERLQTGVNVKVVLDDTLVLAGTVEKTGRVRLYTPHLVNRLDEARDGQRAAVLLDDIEFVSAVLRPD